MKQVDHLGVDPGGLAIAVGIERVESDLHPLEQGNAFNVINRNSVLNGEASVIGTQRKAAVWRQSPQENLDAPSNVGLIALVRVASRRAVQFPITHSDGVTTHVENLFGFASRQLSQPKILRPQLIRERNLLALDERLLVEKEIADRPPGKSSAGKAVCEVPMQIHVQCVVQFGLFGDRRRRVIETL